MYNVCDVIAKLRLRFCFLRIDGELTYFQIHIPVKKMERFTPEQIREYNDAFVMFDADGSGDILVSELREMLKTVGFNPTDEVLEIMTIVIDEVFTQLSIFKIVSIPVYTYV